MKVWHGVLIAAASLLIGGIAGAMIGRLFPPFVLDDEFWRDFWTGPPAGGIFALIGAVIAFGAAAIGASVARYAARRKEWWDRAEWALTRLLSKDKAERRIGSAAVAALRSDGTATEIALLRAALSNRYDLDGSDPDAVDSDEQAAQT